MSSRDVECLSDVDVAAFLAGSGSDDQRRLWQHHVEACEACCAQVQGKQANTVADETCGSTAADASLLQVDSIPGYRILKEVHRGGQGIIYQALQDSTRRKVAVKVLLQGPFAGPDAKKRFEREIAVVGSLRHPNIVPIFDSGVTRGRYYFAMEYVRGDTLAKYVQDKKLSVDDTLRLFKKVCDAVDHAHQKGIIHRDLKPSNILVDNSGEPRVLDFGLARVGAHEMDDSQAQLLSVTGQVMGTLGYMSPEQAAGRPDLVDMRSDVYALGVILYRVLTGESPYDLSQSMASSLRNIQETEPQRPSTRRREVTDEVDTIVLKALSKEKERRYYTAGALGQDVSRYLVGEAIEAKRDSALYVLKKAVHRYRVSLAVAAMIMLLVTAAAIALSVLYYRAESQATIARREGERAKEQTTIAKSAQQEAETTRKALRRELYAADMYAAGLAWNRGDLRFVERMLDRYRSTPEGEEDLRRWEWFNLNWTTRRHRGSRRTSLGLGPYALDVSSNGRQIAVSHHRDAAFTLFDRESGPSRRQTFGRLGIHFWNPSFAVFSPDSTLLAYPSDDMSSVQIMDVNTGDRRALFDGVAGDLVKRAAFRPDGKVIATSSNLRGIELHDLDEQSAPVQLAQSSGTDNNTLGLEFSRDGQLLVGASNDGSLRIWKLDGIREKFLAQSGTGIVRDAKFSPDCQFLASASTDGAVKIWRVETGALVKEIRSGRDQARAVAFSPQGDRLAVGLRDRVVTLWTVPEFQLSDELMGYSGMYALDFAPNGDLVFAGQDSEIVEWNRDTLGMRSAVVNTQPVDDLVFSSRDDQLFGITGDRDDTPERSRLVHRWSLKGGRLDRIEPVQAPFKVGCIAASQNGQLAVGSRERLELSVYEIGGSITPVRIDLVGEGGSFCAQFSPDGDKLAVGSMNGTLVVLSVSERRPLWRHLAHESTVSCIAFSPNGDMILTGSLGGELTLWNASTGSVRSRLEKQQLSVVSVAFAHDGRHFAAGLFGPGAVDSNLVIWDAESLQPTTLPNCPFSIHDVAFLRDGHTLVTSSGDQTTRLIDLKTGRDRLLLDESPHIPQAMAVSFDERTIAVGCLDGSVFIHRAEKE